MPTGKQRTSMVMLALLLAVALAVVLMLRHVFLRA